MERRLIRSSQWMALSLFFLVQTILSMGTYTISVVTPFLKNDWHFTRAQIGALTSALFLGALLSSIVVGWITETFKPKTITILSVIVLGITMLIFPYTGIFTFSFLIMVIAGASYGIYNPTSTLALVQWFETRKRGTAIAIKQTGVTLGAGLSAILISFIVSHTGNWQYSYLWIALLLLLSVSCFFLFYQDALTEEEQSGNIENQGNWLTLLKNRNVLFGSLASMILAGIQYTFAAHFVLYLTNENKLSFAVTAMAVFIAQISGSVGKICWGLMSDFVFIGKRKGVFLSICGLSTLAIAGFGLVTPHISVFLLVFLVIIFGFTALGYAGIYMTFLAESIDSSQIGKALGVGNMFMYIGILICPPLAGWAADAAGSYRNVWFGLSGLSIAATILLTRTKESSIPTGHKEKGTTSA
ncbi:major facilitator superfamily protein [Neobacillus bataviensis LMG 21833]|uniref:Major facilitator superfamily protein n=1 Tax=Neobacillus bataviensis LMG 21833 TaxID=1117379 RepID=K6D379_9BACI|nr:MFS transporter [Neobacillus bataviensis]EKN66962.1 major facilitator superfamily protein [Neobacillus bataviensis LMG 21833]